jgi:transcriptional regulator with XRE-family HTH domain
VGGSGQAVSKWENGESCPEVALLPALCAALEVSADALLGTTKNQGIGTLVRALRERLSALPPERRGQQISATIGHVLSLQVPDEQFVRALGGDLLTTGRMSDGRFHAATLVTQNGSVVHVHGAADLPGSDVPDTEISTALDLLAQPGVVALLRRLTLSDREGTAIRAEARGDNRLRDLCDRLVEADFLVLSRQGYELTGRGLLVSATLLLLAAVPGLGTGIRRLREAHAYGGSW